MICVYSGALGISSFVENGVEVADGPLRKIALVFDLTNSPVVDVLDRLTSEGRAF